MEPGNRTYRDQSGGMRDENINTVGPWDVTPFGWRPPRIITFPRPNGQRLLLIILSLDDTGGTGGDAYTSQSLGQSDYGPANTVGGGGQTGTGPGGINVQSATSGQYDLLGQAEDDDEYDAAVGTGTGGIPTGKPSMTSRVKDDAMTGKMTADPVKQSRGREREEGTF
ncbi:hypothetical protein EI94DRAFT_1808565 [Lactarius quietus]|nr:hypothetical protein EI94DRAFT_1808565 [Lactarius quietus]